MIALLKKLDRKISIMADLDIEVNNLAFHFKVENQEAVILFDRWKDGLALTKHFAAAPESLKNTLKELDTELKRLDLTLSLRKPGVAVLGSRANPLYAFLVKNIFPRRVNVTPRTKSLSIPAFFWRERETPPISGAVHFRYVSFSPGE